MKYIDAEKLKAEIKGKIAELESEPAPVDRETILLQMCKINAFREVLNVINRLEKNSLQQEQPECNAGASKTLDELMEEVKRYYSENYAYITSDQPTLSILTNIARHFYELGLNARKEASK